MTKEELKAKAYDLMVTIEQLRIQLMQINQKIQEMEKGIPVEEPPKE